MNNPAISETTIPKDRRHDLDALRAMAMLLGILLHALLSFVPAAWIVQDSQAGNWAAPIVTAIHGFRMPLFFLISGFFTAMLWRNRGLRPLIKNRVKRIVLPLLISMFTIVPAVWIVLGLVTSSKTIQPSKALLKSAVEASNFDDALSLPMLEAALRNNTEEVSQLISRGANPNATDERGSTAMHLACLFGYSDLADILLDSGADPAIVNADRSRPTDTLVAPWGLTRFYADLLQVSLDRDAVAAGRDKIAQRLNVVIESRNSVANSADTDISGLTWTLLYFPVFQHLWFLWFLCWLVTGFALCIIIGNYLRIPNLPQWIIFSTWRYAWLVPLVAIPQYFMTTIGADTSSGLLPLPKVLFYYAIFFGFGALYFDAKDTQGLVGQHWWVALPLSIFVLLPTAIQLQQSSSPIGHLVAVLCSATYAWLVSFGLMGLFRRHVSAHSRPLRYLSDSSYWLYIVHLPLIIYLQYLVKDWPLTAWLKIPLICLMTSGILLLSYDWFVRYTPIGTLLNGPRNRSPSIAKANE
ncbi:MAG: acyltransferase family protein [Aureliella sp.]